MVIHRWWWCIFSVTGYHYIILNAGPRCCKVEKERRVSQVCVVIYIAYIGMHDRNINGYIYKYSLYI